MVSIWWLLPAFFGGGCAGVLLIALMQMAGDQPTRSSSVPAVELDPMQR